MKRVFIACFVALLCGRGALGEFSYQTLDYPGAANTFVNGIGDNVIVGVYTTTATPFPYHGFIYDGSSYATLDYPGARSTVLSDIDSGRIVGSYTANGVTHGFSYMNGVFTTIDDPLTSPNYANGSEVIGISGNKLVGIYIDNNAATHGYVYDGTSFTTINAPYSGFTSATAIDGNLIVGGYGTGGYEFDGSAFSMLNYPLGTNTTPLDVFGKTVVGYYDDAANKIRGFYYDGTSFTTLNEPASLGQQFIANGISGSTVVGQYIGPHGTYHGFIITVVPEPATVGMLLMGSIGLATRCRRLFSR